MQLTAVIVSAAVALSTGVNAWTQAADGRWIANNVWHGIRGGMPPHITHYLVFLCRTTVEANANLTFPSLCARIVHHQRRRQYKYVFSSFLAF